MAAELRPLGIPFSSLHDMALKFLYYFGLLHQHYAAPVLRDWFQQRGRMTWLMDATIEPGTPAFFGLLEPENGLCLGAWKVASENADELVPCLHQASERFGTPSEVLHDLGDAMTAACEAVWGKGPCGSACATTTCWQTSEKTCTHGPRRRCGNWSASSSSSRD